MVVERRTCDGGGVSHAVIRHQRDHDHPPCVIWPKLKITLTMSFFLVASPFK